MTGVEGKLKITDNVKAQNQPTTTLFSQLEEIAANRVPI